MKYMSTKKIVLCSIGLFSALMLLIGLAFNVFTIDMGYSGAAGSALNDSLGGSVNGFQFMSFSFPTLIETLLLLIYEEGTLSGLAAIFGVLSLLTLLLSLVEIGFLVYALIRGSLDKWNKFIKLFIILNVVFVAVYAVLGIVFTSYWNGALEEKSYAVYSFGTSFMWVSLIFQAISLAGYIVCAVKVPEKAALGEAVEKPSAKAENSDEDRLIALRTVFKEEQEIIDVLKEYKLLCDKSVISTADFISKKAKLLQYTENNIKTKLLSVQDHFNHGVAEAEKLTINLLKEYKQLMDDEVLTSVEFLQKKGSLLEYIIH